MNSKFFLLIKRDFLLFWSMSKIRFINSILLLLIILSIVTYQIKNQLSIIEMLSTNVHFTDIYLYLFWGVKYEIVKTNHFEFPIIWLVLGLLPFYVLGDSFKINIIRYSLFLTGRSISYNSIFAIKSLILVCLFTTYQLIIIIFTFIISLLFFNPVFSIGTFFTSMHHVEFISSSKVILFIIIQMLSLNCLLFLFNCLVLRMKSVYAIIIISILMLSTIYIPEYKILWTNGTMFSRILEFNISEIYIISVEILLSCLFYFIGKSIHKNTEY
ncbi:histidine kinase [Bacillus pretiosus]|uniref:histidine kinase n=1 Tax=Bacillus TaxID=1386 RepID=UPI003D659339